MEKERVADENKLDKLYKKVHGFKPIKRAQESIQREIDNKKEGMEEGELFFFDY